jgi:autophagy-related protein 9
MKVLKRNDDHSSDDDEVPRSLMFEGSDHAKPTRTAPAARNVRGSTTQHAILPTTHPIPVSMPPKPSDLNQPLAPETPQTETHKPMKGLNAYERALWSWVNVYNLDIFLQDVYSYYEGKGIYCIALSQGLNLLSVIKY